MRKDKIGIGGRHKFVFHFIETINFFGIFDDFVVNLFFEILKKQKILRIVGSEEKKTCFGSIYLEIE